MIRPDHGYNDWAIKAFIITMMNDHQSLVSTRKLLWSIRYTASYNRCYIT